MGDKNIRLMKAKKIIVKFMMKEGMFDVIDRDLENALKNIINRKSEKRLLMLQKIKTGVSNTKGLSQQT